MIYKLSIAMILGVLFSWPVSAQEYAPPGTGLQLTHPSAWDASSDGSIITLEADDTSITIYPPDAIEAVINDDPSTLSTRDAATQFLNAMDYTEEAARVRRSQQGTRIYIDYSADDVAGQLIAVPVADQLVIVTLTGDNIQSDDADVQELLASFVLIESEEPLPAESEAPANDLPDELTKFNSIWSDAVAELQQLGVIGTGGGLIFRENRAFFSGQGAWFTPLASQSPRTDIVMAGTLSFTPSGARGALSTEYCSLAARIVTRNNVAVELLEVGMTSNGFVYYYDDYGDSILTLHEDSIRPRGFQLTEPHHFLFLALDDRLMIYLDGSLIFSDREIEERAGSYGVTLTGKGAGATCEATDIWVYESPSFQPGVCEITAGSSVNKRSGPGTSFDLAGQLVPGTAGRAQAQTRAADGFVWWQLDDDSWVRADIVNVQGDCASIPQSSS